MNKMMKIIFGIVFIFSIFSMPSFSIAEVGVSIYENDIDVQTWPENPEPYKNVEIKLISYATDLSKAIIEWRIGSTLVLSGYGKTSYSTTATAPGISTNISVTITPADSINKIVKQIVLKPSDMDMLWEAFDGYTPPFYKGKSLLTKEGTIKVIAIPNSPAIKKGKGNISYKWKNNDESVESVSGYGKDSYMFESSVLKESENISVTASSVDGSYNATKTVNIPIYLPKVIFYKKSPTEGILYNKALDVNSPFTEAEMTVVANPYFLAIKGSEDYFTYKWSINGNKIKTPSKKTELTIRPSSRGGYATIDVVFENINKLFQKVTGSLKLTL